MRTYKILKRNQFHGTIKAKDKDVALRNYLLEIGFREHDLKDKEFMDCWSAV